MKATILALITAIAWGSPASAQFYPSWINAEWLKREYLSMATGFCSDNAFFAQARLSNPNSQEIARAFAYWGTVITWDSQAFPKNISSTRARMQGLRFAADRLCPQNRPVLETAIKRAGIPLPRLKEMGLR